MPLGSRPDRPPLTCARLFMVLNLICLQLCSRKALSLKLICLGPRRMAHGCSWACHLGTIFVKTVNTPRALVNHCILFGAHGERSSLKNGCTKNVENRSRFLQTHSKEQLLGFFCRINLKDLRSCIKDIFLFGWFRHVALGAVVSPAAYAVMASSQDSC